MAYYRVCPHCGGHLDPDEKCDCQNKQDKQYSQRGGEENGRYCKNGSGDYRASIGQRKTG